MSFSTLCDSRWALFTLPADCRSVTHHRRAHWEVGHCQHRLSSAHMLQQHPVYPQEMHDREPRRRCQTLQPHKKKSQRIVLQSQGAVRWLGCHSPPMLMFSMTDSFRREWKHFWWSRGWRVRPDRWLFFSKINTQVAKRDRGTLLETIRVISKMKPELPPCRCRPLSATEVAIYVHICPDLHIVAGTKS